MHKKRRNNQKQRCKNFHVTDEKMHVCNYSSAPSRVSRTQLITKKDNITNQKRRLKTMALRAAISRGEFHLYEENSSTDWPTIDRQVTEQTIYYLQPLPYHPQDKPSAPFLCLGPWLRSQANGFICSVYMTQLLSLPYLGVAPSLLLNSV